MEGRSPNCSRSGASPVFRQGLSLAGDPESVPDGWSGALVAQPVWAVWGGCAGSYARARRHGRAGNHGYAYLDANAATDTHPYADPFPDDYT